MPKLLFLPDTAAIGDDALDLVIDFYNRKCKESVGKICKTEENKKIL
jgi:hypothetical protein